MKTVTIKAPVTVHHGGRYVAPGTPIDLSEDEAKRMTATHGEYAGPPSGDPANTQTLNVLDQASIEELNKHASINGGHGAKRSRISKETLPADAELEAMNKPELVALATARAVQIETTDTKAEIIEKMKAAAQ